MNDMNSHITDSDLLSVADGEMSKRRSRKIRDHLSGCCICRTRMKEIEDAIAEFVREYRVNMDRQMPPASASRAELQARLRELAADRPQTVWQSFAQHLRGAQRFIYVSGTVVALLAVLMLWQFSQPSLALSPNPVLTPGITVPITQTDICSDSIPRTRLVLASVGKKVFEKYGIRNPEPRHYELDYLIDPELGGGDDVRNLWPQPYSAVWSAHVKDALEKHLHDLVCAGTIPLSEAQHDISADWISAYKKYFKTDRPLPEHLAFRKDQPWE
jgi:hypothetical protein